MPDQLHPAPGWHSRGYLPHLDVPGLIQSITIHLADSLPRQALEKILSSTAPDDPERRRRIERLLDAGHGACWLARPEIATIIESALLHWDAKRYRILCWVIMPNHVHTLVQTQKDHPLPQVLHGLKSFTANVANQQLGRTGHLWARDYFDRYIRDDGHLAAVTAYIENNPVKAGLVTRAEDWAFGSARRRSNG